MQNIKLCNERPEKESEQERERKRQRETERNKKREKIKFLIFHDDFPRRSSGYANTVS